MPNITVLPKKSFLARLRAWISLHKIWSAIIILIILGGGWYAYGRATSTAGENQYVLSPARIGTLTQTVTGSGQVSSENQLDVKSEVSGTILSINAKVGQNVKTGDLIATIDSHDAAVDLENARISLAKLTEAAKAGDITNSENAVTKAYTDGFNAVAESFLDAPLIMSGLKDLYYSSAGYLSDQQSTNLTTTGQVYRQTGGASFDKANADYANVLLTYKTLTRASATSSIDSILNDTYDLMKEISEALKNTQSAVTFVSVSQPDYNKSGEATAASNVSNWSSQINTHISALLSSRSAIQSDTDSLARLLEGADTLDVQSSQISLQQKEHEYAKYFIRAPFDGVIGRIPVNVYDTAGSGTVIATLASTQKITTIPLNEIDALKVKTGNPATLTFDAAEGLTLKGTVAQVDLVGTASQGVVTYNVKIAFEGSDDRIRPGMSVDATITTEEKPNVLLVASTAVKTQGQRSYVEVLDSIPKQANSQTTPNTGAGQFGTGRRNFASSTRQFSTTTGEFGTSTRTSATSTAGFSSTTRQFAGNANAAQTTVTSNAIPRQIAVVVGDSNDTDIEILSGLTPGQLIVIRTIAGGSAAAKAAAPSLFSSFGGGQRAGAGAAPARALGR